MGNDLLFRFHIDSFLLKMRYRGYLYWLIKLLGEAKKERITRLGWSVAWQRLSIKGQKWYFYSSIHLLNDAILTRFDPCLWESSYFARITFARYIRKVYCDAKLVMDTLASPFNSLLTVSLKALSLPLPPYGLPTESCSMCDRTFVTVDLTHRTEENSFHSVSL